MDKEQFMARTKGLALRAIKWVEALPKTPAASVIGKQLLRSATSVGANYRAACRAQSTADMIAKLKLWKKKLTRRSTGSNYWWRPTLCPKPG